MCQPRRGQPGSAERRGAIDQVKLGERTIQMISQIELLKASGTQDVVFEGWAGQHARAVNQQQIIGRIEAELAVWPDFFRYAGSIAVLVAGSALIMDGALTIGLLVA
ncbi:MAG: hypothetical protein HC897_12910, partial [Thermoanaerobaculia bacterium]|nr:hypothetical protein [Thermoanaerobaculia bacterium]